MSELRLDPLTGRWVVVGVERALRPHHFLPRTAGEADPAVTCPFCPDGGGGGASPGHEPGDPVSPARVVPNRYPAFEGTASMVVSHLGPVFTQAPASGVHEVLLFSDDHDVTWADLSDDHAGAVLVVVRDRIDEHRARPGLRYSQVIVNSGREAGASVDHPHGQLLGMPFVPREITDEQAGFARFEGRCLVCTVAEAEEGAGHRVVAGDDDVLVICPFWSGSPFEMLVVPRAHQPHLHAAEPAHLAAVGRATRDALTLLRRSVGDVPYNLVFHSAPYRAVGSYHWHVHLLPKLTTPAGFELGTGVPVNVVAPEVAASELRSAASVVEG